MTLDTMTEARKQLAADHWALGQGALRVWSHRDEGGSRAA